MKSTRAMLSAVLAAGVLCVAPGAGKTSENYIMHTVQSGDTLQSLSHQYRMSWKALAKLNAIRKPYRLAEGQTLRIPKPQFKILSSGKSGHALANGKAKAGEVIPVTFFPSSAVVENIRSLLRVETPEMLHWRYIVVHHSATPNGNARGFDAFHRKRRHMEHGLAYHFVIDNGFGGANGLIEVGERWKKQWPGGHTANRLMNEVGIGICLVGNFEKDQPSKQQMESLVVLCKLLQGISKIPDHNVILHRHVAQRGTLCPGRRFPLEKLRRMLMGIRLPADQG